jgi:hypothetical protein
LQDDRHRGSNGKNCDKCHSTRNWAKASFNHDKDTRFKLRHKHKIIACRKCHKNNAFKVKLGIKCISCHKQGDPHKGQQGTQCHNCHTEKGWHVRVVFDHGVTRFPLIGQHSIVACEECHASEQYKNASASCNQCHAKKDKHEKSLGTVCETCHNPNGWKFWRFDHNKQTRFTLENAHKKAACSACHIKGKKASGPGTDCGDCHASDDEHNGQFGSNCSRCHSTRNFKEIRINR